MSGAEHASRQTVTGNWQEEAVEKAEVQEKSKPAKSRKAKKKAKAAKKAKVAKKRLDHLQTRTQDPATQPQSKAQVLSCMHQFHWTAIPGRSRCEYHSYTPNAYRNPFRYRCPGCNTVACGLCIKKVRRRDTLS
jgi:hypothetical protein